MSPEAGVSRAEHRESVSSAIRMTNQWGIKTAADEVFFASDTKQNKIKAPERGIQTSSPRVSGPSGVESPSQREETDSL